ncbi:unnamed protein product, partial [Symbiodinium sp. KB8]
MAAMQGPSQALDVASPLQGDPGVPVEVDWSALCVERVAASHHAPTLAPAFSPACRADVAHEGEGVFISTKDIALLEEYQGNDSAALAELLSSDEDAAQYVSVLMKVLENISSHAQAVCFSVSTLNSILT